MLNFTATSSQVVLWIGNDDQDLPHPPRSFPDRLSLKLQFLRYSLRLWKLFLQYKKSAIYMRKWMFMWKIGTDTVWELFRIGV